MKRLILSATALLMAVSFAAAQRKTVSILGDSYSTFEGFLTPSTNAIYYYRTPWGGMDVKSASETWWMKFISDNGYQLCVNNSFSGSTVCNSGRGGKDMKASSFITRMSDLGCPDVILIFGGTNDSWQEVPMGEYKYEGWNDQDLNTFRPAMAYMLSWMKERYVNTEIYFILNDGLSDQVDESVNTVCGKYGIPVITLHDISKTNSHPNKKGMAQIATQIAETVKSVSYHHPWQGRKVAYLGDSITDPNVKASKVKYWGFLEQWLGITPYVYAVSGREWNDIPRQADKLKADHADDFDAIMVFMGTNDYNSGVRPGEWFTEKPEKVEYAHHTQKTLVRRDRRSLCMDRDTYKGRINIALSKMKSMYPDKQIVLLTPIHRSIFHSGNTNWQCSEDYTNQCGEYLDEYVEAVKEAGLIWSVPVIDLNSLCGLYPLLPEHAKFFNNDNDLLHPNDLGHERMAKTIMQQLTSIPVF